MTAVRLFFLPNAALTRVLDDIYRCFRTFLAKHGYSGGVKWFVLGSWRVSRCVRKRRFVMAERSSSGVGIVAIIAIVLLFLIALLALGAFTGNDGLNIRIFQDGGDTGGGEGDVVPPDEGCGVVPPAGGGGGGAAPPAGGGSYP